MAKLLIVSVLLALGLCANAFQNLSLQQFLNHREPNPVVDVPITSANVSLLTVEQYVDNFNPQNLATWNQRYYVNTEFYQPGGPLYIFLSGEWRITPARVTDSLFVEIAQEMYGHVSYLEHRYYGESFPTENLSDDNLRYLTPDQALADVAHFIQHLKETVEGSEDSPVILIGAHYSGTLAAWFRAKYPHLALAAWASSSPVLSVIDHSGFKELAGESFRNIGGPECYNAIESGFAEMEYMAANGQLAQLSELFNLCDPIESPNDIATFFAVVAEFYSILPQFATLASINAVCGMLASEAATSPAVGVSLVLDVFLGDTCIVVDYDSVVEYDRQIELDAPSVVSGIRQASYQLCTQLGWHHTSTSENQPFGTMFPLEFYLESCDAVFGAVFSNETAHMNSERVNTIHGGLTPSVTNVIFTQGSLDPWRGLGVQSNLNENAPLFVINGASQSNDLNSISPNDSQALYDTKNQIKYLLRYWIARDQGIEVVPYNMY